MPDSSRARFGVVVIGRNEGERLKRCLASVIDNATVIYVDSGSSDGSVEYARGQKADVVELDSAINFTAGLARNAGFARLQDIAPQLEYVQFVDGDCELNAGWPQVAISFLESRPGVCAVFGRRRERYPERSVYNRLCDFEWDVPIGDAKACGGDVMIRASMLRSVGGYREDIIAGEEPELCIRMRAAGGRVWRLGAEMTLHDANIVSFRQWWRRNVRSGYAYAQGADIHGAGAERHWVWESRRALLWAIAFPLICTGATIAFGVRGLTVLLIYPMQFIRRAIALEGSLSERTQRSFFEVLTRFPESFGQIKFHVDRMFRRKKHLIEYK